MKTTAFAVVTAEGTVEEADATSVTVPTADGEITVLPEHIPLVSVLEPGVVTVRVSKQERHVAVSGGFVQVVKDSVTILADTAERADQIDVRRAEAARKRAEDVMAGKREKAELAEASGELQKNLARLRAVELVKRRKPGTRAPSS
ncbi:ATP synthase F1 subunit epsilon [Patescibacteria group bacterium]|nr:ATP synthase F1 subunit epsilon [Patescibacteria group bacterium]